MVKQVGTLANFGQNMNMDALKRNPQAAMQKMQ